MSNQELVDDLWALRKEFTRLADEHAEKAEADKGFTDEASRKARLVNTEKARSYANAAFEVFALLTRHGHSAPQRDDE